MFKPKDKEPKLSEKIESILNRSMGDKIESNTDEIFRYKHKIMKQLVSNQDILHTLHNIDLQKGEDVINGDLYRDVCVFDYMKLPDNKTEVKNYICFEVDDDGYGDFANKIISFRTVSHEDDHKTDWGISRQDLLALIVKEEFDWSNILGMHLEKKSDEGMVTNDGYCYREIVYKATSPNNIYGKINNKRF